MKLMESHALQSRDEGDLNSFKLFNHAFIVLVVAVFPFLQAQTHRAYRIKMADNGIEQSAREHMPSFSKQVPPLRHQFRSQGTTGFIDAHLYLVDTGPQPGEALLDSCHPLEDICLSPASCPSSPPDTSSAGAASKVDEAIEAIEESALFN